MRLEHSFVQREDATAHLSHLETGQGLAVDFHPAVKHIDLGEQLALRTDGLHCSAEFWLSVMGKDHVLQHQGYQVLQLRWKLPVRPSQGAQGVVPSPSIP